jgi:hypothetical protein
MKKPQKVNEALRDDDLGEVLPKKTGKLNRRDAKYSILYISLNLPKTKNRKT